MRKILLSAAALAGLVVGCSSGTEPGPPRLPPERTAKGQVIRPNDPDNPGNKPMPRPVDVRPADNGGTGTRSGVAPATGPAATQPVQPGTVR